MPDDASADVCAELDAPSGCRPVRDFSTADSSSWSSSQRTVSRAACVSSSSFLGGVFRACGCVCVLNVDKLLHKCKVQMWQDSEKKRCLKKE